MEKSFKNLRLLGCLALFFILAIVLLGGVFADLANVKTYNISSEQITFKSGLTSESIATAKLLTSHINFVSAGTDVKIAEIEVNSFEEYSQFLKGVDFYNNITGSKIDRPFSYKLKTFEDYEAEIPVYKLVLDKNGTYFNEITGYTTEKRQRVIWKEASADLKAENITIGIFSNLAVGEKLEWIPELFGLKCSEWAIVIETNLHGQDLSNQQTTNYAQQGIDFISDTNLSLTTIVKDSNCQATQGCLKDLINGSVLACAPFVGDEANFTTAFNLTAGHQYVLIANVTAAGSWNLRYSAILAGFPYVVNNISYIGGYDWTAGDPYNSTRLWNVIGMRYYYQKAATPPIVTIALAAAPNNTNSSSTFYYFNSTANVAFGNFTNATLYLMSASQTLTNFTAIASVPTNVSLNRTYSNIPEGDYKWFYLYTAIDYAGKVFSTLSANNTFGVHIIPNATIFQPNQTFTGETYIPLNFSAADETGLSACWYNVTRGASLEIDNTFINCSLNTTFTVSSDANYILNLCVNDTINNKNCTSASFKTTAYIPVSSSPGSGGGGFIQKLTEVSNLKICDATEAPFSTAWTDFKANKNWANFKVLWRAFWNVSLCKSGASIIGVE
jgi:hypothetical protein